MDSVNFNVLDQRFITGLYLKEALLRDRSKNLGKHFIVRLYARLVGDSDQKKLDDTEAEILYQRTTLEQREVPPMKLQETPSPERARRNPMRETATIRWSPNIDHRFDGIPQAVVQQASPRTPTESSSGERTIF